MSQLSEKMVRWESWCRSAHGFQTRKYSNEPYFDNHSLIIARKAFEFGIEYGFEVACGHDVIEDTPMDRDDVFDGLILCGYSGESAGWITHAIVELTDVYTKTRYPEWNRAKRKEAENERIWRTGELAQDIKFLDIAHNLWDIRQHDPDFSIIFAKEAQRTLRGMNHGDHRLRIIAMGELYLTQKPVTWQGTI